ncbi:MAG: YIP1 family protein [Candidatus Helarchaeota archaeon]
MNDLTLFRNVIIKPSESITVLKEKSFKLLWILIIINILLFGTLYLISHFFVNIFHPSFYLLLFIVGLLGVILSLWFLILIYYVISKLLKEKNILQHIRLLAYYFMIVFTILNAISLPIIIILLFSNTYYLGIYYYDLSHIVFLIWVLGLCIQGIQKLCNENEIKTFLKVSASIFTSYALVTIIYILVSSVLAVAIVR